MKRRRIATALLVSVLAGVGLVAPPAEAQSSNTCGTPVNVDADGDRFEGKKVVLVLHGWNGSEMEETVELLRGSLPVNDWVVEPFSYESTNADWPDDESAAVECLREVISQVGGATQLTIPSVYIVAHSMGGILARFALNRDDNLQYDELIGGVVTIDTPHKGSPWGASELADRLQATAVSEGSSSAATCLALHHPGAYPDECKVPPAISADIPVLQVAGSATLTRTFFMISRDEVDTDSDGIVWTESQAGYHSSVDSPLPAPAQATSSVVRCDVGWGAAVGAGGNTWSGNPVDWWDGTIAAAIQAGTSEIMNYDAAIWALGAISRIAPCGHSEMVTNAETIERIVAALNEWAGTGRNSTEAILPAGGKWLWELPLVDPLHETGQRETAVMVSRDGVVTEFPNSTNLWVPCADEVQTVYFDLGTEFTKIQLAVGVTSDAPASLSTISYDMKLLNAPNGEGWGAIGLSYSQENGMGTPRTYEPFSLNGKRYLGVEVWNPYSDCETTERNYASLVQAYVW